MSRLTEINKDACDLCNLDCKHMDNSCEKAKIYNKLKYYEDLEEEIEKIWGDGASITKLVNSLNKCACSADGYLDFARILTNDDAEKWLRWKELAKQDRLIELPCKVGETLYAVAVGCSGSRWDCSHNCDQCDRYMCCVYEEPFIIDYINEIGDWIFLTKEEAFAKLAELRGDL